MVEVHVQLVYKALHLLYLGLIHQLFLFRWHVPIKIVTFVGLAETSPEVELK